MTDQEPKAPAPQIADQVEEDMQRDKPKGLSK